MFHRSLLRSGGRDTTPGSKCFKATGGVIVKPGHVEMLERRAQKEKPFISPVKETSQSCQGLQVTEVLAPPFSQSWHFCCCWDERDSADFSP